MKCTNCGGEVDSQAITCPYCGSRNEEGIAFYKDVYQKVSQNKLLAPLLLRQKTPELIQRMLTRIIVAMGIMGVVFMGISVVMVLMTDDPIFSDAEPDPNSYAAEYVVTRNDYYYREWAECVSLFMEAWNSGNEKNGFSTWQMLNSGFHVYYDQDMDQQLQEQTRLEVDALLEGILQLSGEELALFHNKGEQYGFYVYPDSDALEELGTVIEAKLAARSEDIKQ